MEKNAKNIESLSVEEREEILVDIAQILENTARDAMFVGNQNFALMSTNMAEAIRIHTEARVDSRSAPGLVDDLGCELLHHTIAATRSFRGRKANPIELSEMPYGMNSWSPTRIPPHV